MRRLALLVAVVALSSGCAGALKALQVANIAADYLTSVVELADTGQEAYFARHPNLDAQNRVGVAMLSTRRALAAYQAASAAVSAGDAGDTKAARAAALEAYGELRALLDELGVLSGTAEGGAETEAPDPGPLVLPTVTELEGER